MLLVVFSCSSSKAKASPEQLLKLETIVNTKNYKIDSDLAFPQVTSAMNSLQNSGLIAPGSNVSRIDLIGNENYVKIIGDSIFAELPYFGERQFNVAYNGKDSSISIKNVVTNYNVHKNSKNNGYDITFEANNDRENFRFKIIVFPNLSTDMIVYGSTRFSIRYTGNAKELN